MNVRDPAVAGGFYPDNPDELKNIIKYFLEKVDVRKREVIALLAPHAGYTYCGKTFASVYKTVGNKFDTAVILGSNHSGMGAGVATCMGSWRTPLGLVETDEVFFNEITSDSIIVNDPKPHSREHSVEVQLPWLQYIFNYFKIVPILVKSSHYDVKSSEEIGNKIAEVVKRLKRRVLIIASSDLTHYGTIYGHVPYRGEPKEIIERIKEDDMNVISSIEKLKPEKVIETVEKERLTVCGYGPIASMLFAAKKLEARKGELIDYSTSYDVSKNLDAVVGYAGVAIY
jgi:AmmeMemoRadiSam system protein B